MQRHTFPYGGGSGRTTHISGNKTYGSKVGVPAGLASYVVDSPPDLVADCIVKA